MPPCGIQLSKMTTTDRIGLIALVVTVVGLLPAAWLAVPGVQPWARRLLGFQSPEDHTTNRQQPDHRIAAGREGQPRETELAVSPATTTQGNTTIGNQGSAQATPSLSAPTYEIPAATTSYLRARHDGSEGEGTSHWVAHVAKDVLWFDTGVPLFLGARVSVFCVDCKSHADMFAHSVRINEPLVEGTAVKVEDMLKIPLPSGVDGAAATLTGTTLYNLEFASSAPFENNGSSELHFAVSSTYRYTMKLGLHPDADVPYLHFEIRWNETEAFKRTIQERTPAGLVLTASHLWAQEQLRKINGSSFPHRE